MRPLPGSVPPWASNARVSKKCARNRISLRDKKIGRVTRATLIAFRAKRVRLHCSAAFSTQKLRHKTPMATTQQCVEIVALAFDIPVARLAWARTACAAVAFCQRRRRGPNTRIPSSQPQKICLENANVEQKSWHPCSVDRQSFAVSYSIAIVLRSPSMSNIAAWPLQGYVQQRWQDSRARPWRESRYSG